MAFTDLPVSLTVAPVTSSGGVGVTILAGSASGSTAINLVGSSGGIAPVTTSGGQLVSAWLLTTGAEAPVTSSGGVGVTILGGAASGSTVVSLSSAIAISSGTVTLSSSPTIISASSGLVGLSAWSSAQGYGAGVNAFTYVSSSSANVNSVKTSGGMFYGFYAFNTTASIRYLKVYNSSSAPTIGSTAKQIGNYGIPYSTGGGGAQHMFTWPVQTSNGLAFTITNGVEATSTGSIGAKDIGLTLYYL